LLFLLFFHRINSIEVCREFDRIVIPALEGVVYFN